MVNEAAEVKQIMPLDISFNMSSSYGVALHMQADRRSLQQLLKQNCILTNPSHIYLDPQYTDGKTNVLWYPN